MNAETRAKEIIDELCFCDSELRRLIGDYGIDLIAKAITRAENDKLEEVAAWLDNLPGGFGPAWIPDEIRALKKD